MNEYRHAFATLSFVAEIFIFLYVGMDALDIEKWKIVSNRYVLSKKKKGFYETVAMVKL